MPITGIVQNGRVEFDAPVTWPDGSRVTLALDEDEVYEYPHPMAPYDREKEMELLKESIEDMKAGRVRDAFEVLDELRRELEENVEMQRGIR